MRRLHRALGTLLVAVASLAWLACSRDPASAGDRTGALSLMLQFPADAKFPSLALAPETLPVDSLSVRVWGAGMDTMRVVVPVVNKVASGTVEGIPAGSNRIVEARAWCADPLVPLYRGVDTVAIEAGKVTDAVLTMDMIQNQPGARLALTPDTTWVGHPVVADAAGSFDPYYPDSLLMFRFTLNGEGITEWAPARQDTFLAPPRGSWPVAVLVKNDLGAVGTAERVLLVRNSAPDQPSSPVPAPGDTVWTLLPTVHWHAEDPDGDAMTCTVWFGADSAAVSAGISPATSVVTQTDSASLSGLQPATRWYWRVIASDGEESAGGDLWQFVTAPAAFTVQPDSLLFPCGVDALPVVLTATGRGLLAWTATAQVPWLAVSPSSGILGGSPAAVQVSVVSRAGLPPGWHDGIVEFHAGGFTVPVAVEMEVAPLLGGALPESLLLTAPTFADTIALTNVGCGDLNWATSTGAPWLVVEPPAGVVPGGMTSNLAAVGDTSRLSPGDHTTLLYLQVLDVTSPIVVTVRVGPSRCLDVEPDSVYLEETSPSAACTLLNCGAEAITWSATPADGWVTVTPGAGTVEAQQSQVVSIAVDMTGLASGPATSGVLFNGADQPVYLKVAALVPGSPVLQLTFESLYLPADTDVAQTMLGNAGTGVLSWVVTSLPSWAVVSPSTGLLGQGEATLLRLTADRTELPLGTHTGEVVIASNGGSASLEVVVDVMVEGCGNPLFSDTFAGVTAEGWVADASGGIWRVVDGRYTVEGIPEGGLALAQHPIERVGPTSAQMDVALGTSSDATASVSLACRVGSAIAIEGTAADAVAAAVDQSGLVRLQARAVADGQWFSFGDAGTGLCFPGGWNSVAVELTETHVLGVLNDETVVQYDFPGQVRLPHLASVALTGTGQGVLSFDRVFVCAE